MQSEATIPYGKDEKRRGQSTGLYRGEFIRPLLRNPNTKHPEPTPPPKTYPSRRRNVSEGSSPNACL